MFTHLPSQIDFQKFAKLFPSPGKRQDSPVIATEPSTFVETVISGLCVCVWFASPHLLDWASTNILRWQGRLKKAQSLFHSDLFFLDHTQSNKSFVQRSSGRISRYSQLTTTVLLSQADSQYLQYARHQNTRLHTYGLSFGRTRNEALSCIPRIH